MCPKWPLVCFICHRHNPILSSYMTISRFVAWVMRQVSYAEHELPIVPEHPSWCVVQSLFSVECFVDNCFFLLPVFCHCSGCSSIDSLWFPISNFSNISYSDMYCDPMIGLNYVMLIYLLIIFIKDITNIYFLNIFFGNPAGVVCFSNNLVFPLVLFINHRSIAIYRCVFLVLSIRLIMIIIWYFKWFSKDV